jgi:tripartite-type tricarboxylate transporter receptor subunit TctC
MFITFFRKALIGISFSLLVLLGHQANAQQKAQNDYPNRPIRVVIPYVAGGPMDFIGRTLGQKLTPVLGQSFIIDNKPGAGGALGTDIVAKSAPDGYTILDTSSSHASLPIVASSLPYDPIKDFQPITLVANSVGFVIATRPDLPAKNLQEFIADAKANPDRYTYGSGGIGNVMHFATEFFNNSAGIKMVHVPYKGVGQALTDLMSGRIDVFIGPGTAIAPYVKAGKIRALAITANKRWAELPDTPTADEAGVKGFVYAPWYGFWFPAGVPKEYVTRLRNEIAKILSDPEVKKSFYEQGFITSGSTPEEFSRVIANEIEVNKKLATKIDFSEK